MKKTNLVSLILGIFIGISILNPLAQATENWLKATPSAQKFFVNGKQAELEAYAINGHNYVKLRDIGKVANFSVSYDPMANCVIVRSDQPYEEDATKEPGEAAAPVATPTPAPAAVPDYSAQANPAIFTDKYTRQVYNAMRYAVLHPEEIAAGTYQPISVGEVDGPMVLNLVSRLNAGDAYFNLTEKWGDKASYLSAKHREECDAAIAHVRPFLDSIANLPRQEQVRQMVWYIADRMTYSTQVRALPSTILAQDEIMEGAGSCMTYSSCLYFLCQQAGIPCVLPESVDHQWCMVYVDGQWWQVDPTGPNDNVRTLEYYGLGDGTVVKSSKTEAERRADLERYRASATVLHKVIGELHLVGGGTRIDESYVDLYPERTRFLQELLVPGSTR